MINAAGASGGDHRHLHGLDHRPGEGKVVARLGAIAVHGGEQDLAGAERHHAPGPGHRIEAGVVPPTFDEDIPGRGITGPGGTAAGIDRHNDALAAEAVGTGRHQLRRADRGGIQAHLVSAGPQQLRDALDADDAAAHREGNRHRLGGALHHVHQGGPALVAGGDVEENQLVGTGDAVATGQFHRVAGIPQTHEIDTLHNPAPGHVETGDDPFGYHGFTVKVAQLSTRAGHGPGWHHHRLEGAGHPGA